MLEVDMGRYVLEILDLSLYNDVNKFISLMLFCSGI